MARTGETKEAIRNFLQKRFGYNLALTLAEIRAHHTFNSRTAYSVPPAIIAFLESSDYESAVRGAVSLGGDADTEACIAGGIAEAYYREIPDSIRRFCHPKIDSTIRTTVREFCNRYTLMNQPKEK